MLQTEAEHAAVFWVRRVYLWLIFAVIGGMLVHNALDLCRKFRNPPDRRPLTGGGAPSTTRRRLSSTW